MDEPGCPSPTPYGRPVRARKEDDDPVDYRFKIVIVGESMVGKTNLLSRFERDEFNAVCKSTIGVDFAMLTFWLDGKCMKLQIWDTASQQRYRVYTPTYYVGATGVLLVYDTTNAESFVQLEKWLAEVREFGEDDVVVTLVGNKTDLHEKRAVSVDEALAFCKAHKIGYFETSARNNSYVDTVFHGMLGNMYNAQSVREMERHIGVEPLDASEDIHASKQRRRHVLQGLKRVKGLNSTFRRARPGAFRRWGSGRASNDPEEPNLR
jgi:small GTP-binding protein